MASVSYELARCHACGGGDTDELSDSDGVRAEVDARWEFHTRRLTAPSASPWIEVSARATA